MPGVSVPYALCPSHSQREDLPYKSFTFHPAPSTQPSLNEMEPGQAHTPNALYRLAVLPKYIHVM